ncbi:MAG: hypothetical protein ACOYBY_03235 [Dermatophilaceae bacterium]
MACGQANRERRSAGTIVANSLQHRLTTPQRLLAELDTRARHPRRRLLEDMIGDDRDGSHSCW